MDIQQQVMIWNILFIISCINFPHISLMEWQQWSWTLCNC